jgi:hypothetical protein
MKILAGRYSKLGVLSQQLVAREDSVSARVLLRISDMEKVINFSPPTNWHLYLLPVPFNYIFSVISKQGMSICMSTIVYIFCKADRFPSSHLFIIYQPQLHNLPTCPPTQTWIRSSSEKRPPPPLMRVC